MAQTKSLLDEPIEEINVPVMRPTRYTQRKKPPFIYIKRYFGEFADWIISHVPKPMKKKVDDKVEKLKKDIKRIYSRYDELELYEKEAPIEGFLKTHRIDGKMVKKCTIN